MAALLGAAAPVHAQRDREIGGIGLTVWSDSNYRGSNHTFRDDNPDLRSIGHDQPHLQFARGTRRGLGGLQRVTIRGTLSGVFGRRAGPSAARVERHHFVRAARAAARRWRRLPRAPDQTGSSSTPAYDYSGQRIALSNATSDFRRIDFNDRAMSLRVPRNQAWEICVHNDYDDCRVVTEDVPDSAGSASPGFCRRRARGAEAAAACATGPRRCDRDRRAIGRRPERRRAGMRPCTS